MKINLNKENLIGLTALLIHAAKIDENYSNHEKEIIISLIKSIFSFSGTQRNAVS